MASTDDNSPTSAALHPAGKQPQSLRLLSKVSSNIATTSSSESTSELPLHLDVNAHRRWYSAKAVKFLQSIDRIEVQDTEISGDKTYYVMEVHVNSSTTSEPSNPSGSTSSFSLTSTELMPASLPTTYQVKRRYSDFEKLREDVNESVSVLPQCTCEYCVDFVLYIRYNVRQPRMLMKLAINTEKRKSTLNTFINDFVRMGRRQVERPRGKRECQAQKLVPGLLHAFLLEQ